MCLVPSISKRKVLSANLGTARCLRFFGLLAVLVFSQRAPASATGPQDGSTVLQFMIVDPADQDRLFSETPPAFEMDPDAGPRGILQNGALLRVRVKPSDSETWRFQDCRLAVEPGFLRFHARWLSPNLPELNLVRGRRMEYLDWRRVFCQEFRDGVEHYEFVIKAPAAVSFHIKPSESSELFAREDLSTFGFLTGMAMMAVCFASLLALYFRSGRLALQSAGLALTLVAMNLRYHGPLAGLVEVDFFIDARLFARVAACITLTYCMHVLAELKHPMAQRALKFGLGFTLIVGLIPLTLVDFTPANFFIFVGVPATALALVLNISAMIFAPAGRPQLAIRILRTMTISVMLLEVLTLMTDLEIQGLLPLWCISILVETFTAVLLVMRSHRAEIEIGKSVDRRLSDLTSESSSLSREIEDVEKSFVGVQTENDGLEQANRELMRAMDDVTVVEEALTDRRQRLHFTELLGFRLAGLGHDLMNPLGLARGVMEILPEEGWTVDEKLTKKQFIDEVDRMTALRTAVRIFGRPEAAGGNSGRTASRLFHVKSVLLSSVDLFKLSNDTCHITVEADDAVFLNGFASDLSRVVVELLSNASRAASHSRRPPKIRLVLTTCGEDSIIELHDSGPGFSENDTASLVFGLLKDQPGDGPKEFHLGFGLVMAARLVGELGGKLDIMDERSDLGGAILQVRLPLPQREVVAV